MLGSVVHERFAVYLVRRVVPPSVEFTYAKSSFIPLHGTGVNAASKLSTPYRQL